MMQMQGRKEIQEAVITAALCAVATGLVGIGVELLKRQIFAKPEPPKEPQKKEIGFTK